jgi:hypothetical protein
MKYQVSLSARITIPFYAVQDEEGKIFENR